MTKVQQVTIQDEDAGIRLDKWFKRHYPNVSHTSVEKALRKGQIKVDGKKVKSNHRVSEGEIVRVPPMTEYEREEKPKARIDSKYIKIIQESVIYKDDDIIVINKPAGIATQGGVGVRVSIDDLLEYLKFDYENKPKLVHRLDKDTSGILLIARKASSASKLTKSFREKDMEKIYLALVVGIPKELEAKVSYPLLKADIGAGKEKVVVDLENGQNAVTYYKVLERLGRKLCLVELRPITGRTHQLRVHMAEIGNPILGDGKYGGKDAFIEGLSNKMHLHAYQIKVPDDSGKIKTYTAKLISPISDSFKELGFDEENLA